jgi:hypothetical protein
MNKQTSFFVEVFSTNIQDKKNCYVWIKTGSLESDEFIDTLKNLGSYISNLKKRKKSKRLLQSTLAYVQWEDSWTGTSKSCLSSTASSCLTLSRCYYTFWKENEVITIFSLHLVRVSPFHHRGDLDFSEVNFSQDQWMTLLIILY